MNSQDSPWLIAGLGNPGSEYEDTRHNFGFLVLEELLSKLDSPMSSWKEQKGAQLCKGQLSGDSVILVKPFTYMNLSGEPLRGVMDFFKVDKKKLVVIHDEVDLPFGSVKLKSGGGDGGHNGIKSVISHCGGRDFLRIRMGVGRPEDPRFDTSNWVLGSFSQDEKGLLPELVSKGVDAVKALLSEDLASAQKIINSGK